MNQKCCEKNLDPKNGLKENSGHHSVMIKINELWLRLNRKKKIFKIELFFQTHRHKWKSFVSIDSWLLYTQCKFIHLIKMMLNYYESWNKRQQKTKKIFNTFSHRSWFLCLNFIDFDLTLIHLSPLLIFSFSLAKPKGRNEMKKSKYPNSHDNDDYQIESKIKSILNFVFLV